MIKLLNFAEFSHNGGPFYCLCGSSSWREAQRRAEVHIRQHGGPRRIDWQKSDGWWLFQSRQSEMIYVLRNLPLDESEVILRERLSSG